MRQLLKLIIKIDFTKNYISNNYFEANYISYLISNCNFMF